MAGFLVSAPFLRFLMRRLILCSTLLLAIPGCNLNTFRRTPVAAAGFARKLNVDTTAMTLTPSGLRYQDLKVGDGAVAARGNVVKAAYTGWLTDGTRFDGGQYEFPLGEHQVIDGWDEGLAGMRVGGKRKLVVPAALGYKAEGSPPVIPPDAILVFDVELLSVR